MLAYIAYSFTFIQIVSEFGKGYIGMYIRYILVGDNTPTDETNGIGKQKTVE